MVTLRRHVAVAVLLTLTATACGTPKQEALPTTTTTTRQTTTTTTTPPPPSAPPVTNPLDANQFIANPCASLTETQQRDYRIARTERTTLAENEGESCFFYRAARGDNFWIVYSSRISSGLDYRYSQHDTGSWGVWSETELGGYPAVTFGNSNPPACFFAVGLSDSLHFFVTSSIDSTCTEARAFASTVLENIKRDN